MKKQIWFVLPFVLLLCSIVFLPTGCGPFGGKDTTYIVVAPTGQQTLTGKILKSDTPASIRASKLYGQTEVAGAEVWIENLADNPNFHTVADASGSYSFSNVPAGIHRIVSKYSPGIGMPVVKNISPALTVSEDAGAVIVTDLFLFKATNIVKGRLKDSAGNPLPTGTKLSLWGEEFAVGANGTFVSPPLPDAVNQELIKVTLPDGTVMADFSAPFVSGVVPAVLELSLDRAGDNTNHAPSVVLKAFANQEISSKVSPGGSLKIVAIGEDHDVEDQGSLAITWNCTAGNFTDGKDEFNKTWNAPPFLGVATLCAEITDRRGKTGKISLPILIGIDDPSQVDSGRPNPKLTAEVESVTNSAPFHVTVTFNEPVKDFTLEKISAENASLDEFSVTTNDRVFRVRVTPENAGEIKVFITENAVTDYTGNQNLASNILSVNNSIIASKSSEKEIISFSAMSVAGTIDSGNKKVILNLPHGTDITNLISTFSVSEKASVKIGDQIQTSGTTPNDFSSAITYTVIAEDGSSQNWEILVFVSHPTQVTSAQVAITAPVFGATPENAAAVEAATSNADYTVTALTWNETLTADGKFKAGQIYTATVTLTSKNSKKFQTEAFTPIVSSAESVGTTTTTGTDVGNTVSFTATFTATGNITVTSIEITTQPTKLNYAEGTDGTLSLNGMVITETYSDASTRTVTFTDGTAAGYISTPGNGTALTNATNDGKPVIVINPGFGKNVSTNNLTVTAIPKISSADIRISAPVLSETPENAATVETATSNADYTVTTLTWNESLTAGGKFKAGQAYSATITLTSKNGKKFQSAQFTPTVSGSASVGTTTTTGSDIGNTVSFTVTFASTGALAVNNIAITAQPTKLSYAEGTDKTLALNGMQITETMNDGTSKTVPFTDGTAAGYTANPANGSVLTHAANNGQPVAVTHTASGKIVNTNNLTVSAIQEISAAAVTITAPVLGEIPQNAAVVEAATSNADYTVSALTWNEPMTAAGTFKAEQAYTATLTLTSKNNKKFQAAAFKPTVPGLALEGPTTTAGSDIGNTVSFTVTYVSTGALAVASIAVTTQPAKLSYAEGTENLALNSMVITETNNDGSTNAVTFTGGTASGYTANPANGAALSKSVNNSQPVVITHSASGQTANTNNLTVYRDCASPNIGTLKFVPAGTFQRDATPANTSYVSAFRMAQYEITRAQYSAIMGNDPSDTSTSTGTDDPAQNVTWHGALVFCNKLSIAEGLTPVYTINGSTNPDDWGALPVYNWGTPFDPNSTWNTAICNWSANGYRLPTEMEWMWAAMGADQDSQPGAMSGGINVTGYNKIFSGYNGSNSVDSYGWHSNNSSGKTHPKGTLAANELNIYDMSGNVREWCWDWYDNYPAGAISNYTGAESSDERLVRGASWKQASGPSLPISLRDREPPSSDRNSFGFRVIRSR